MTTMVISVSDEIKAFIEAQLAKEGYASASEYVGSLIRAAQKRQAKQALEAKLREALESGPATPMTCEDWDSIEQEALDRLASEKPSHSILTENFGVEGSSDTDDEQ
jgi:antitoxin ParD1/3/4